MSWYGNIDLGGLSAVGLVRGSVDMDTIFLLIGIGVVIGFPAGMLYGYERGREDTMRAHNIMRGER